MITLLYCGLCICAFAATHTLRLTFGKRQPWFYVWYTAMCVFTSLYIAATIMHYQADSDAISALGLRIQTSAAMAYVVSFCWFVFKFTNMPYGKVPLIAFSVITSGAAVYALTLEYSIRYLDLDDLQIAELPWGEVLEFRSGTANPIYSLYHLLAQTAFAWGMVCTFFMRKKEDRLLRNLLLVYGVLQSGFLVLGKMIGTGELHFFYVDWAPAVWLFVAMSFHFSGEQVRLSKLLTEEIVERKSIEKQLNESALFDDLTGLPNHQALVAKLNQLVTTADTRERYLFFIGIRDFKSINLTYGSDNADALLIEFARRLESKYVGNIFAAREAGDCFALIMEDSPESEMTIAEVFRDRRWSDLAGILKPFTIGEQEILLKSSIGVVHLHADITSSQKALLMAGLAMSEARTSKRPVYYDRDLINEASTLRAREIDFAAALRSQTLSLYAQPQVSAEGQVHGVEMLTRWKHSSEGFIPPDTFIPMAERLGLIGFLGTPN